MTSPPDKLFRDQLSSLEKSPPPGAWSRIESALHTRSTAYVWLRVAAAVIIILAFGTMFWPTKDVTPLSQTTPMTNSTPSNPAVQSSTTDTPSIVEDQTTPPPAQARANPSPIPETIQEVKKTNTVHEVAGIQNASNKKEIPTSAEPSVAEVVTAPAVTRKEDAFKAVDVITPPTPVSTLASGRKITYSASEVNARFLKKPAETPVLLEEKSLSGLQKIIDIAYSIKHDDSAIGDLRGMKNEILSLPIKDKSK